MLHSIFKSLTKKKTVTTKTKVVKNFTTSELVSLASLRVGDTIELHGERAEVTGIRPSTGIDRLLVKLDHHTWILDDSAQSITRFS